MNKLIPSVLAAAALAVGASAFAQSAECQRGIESGVWNNPCGHQSNSPTDPWGRNYGLYPNGTYGYPAAVLSQIFGSNAYPYTYTQPQVVPQYNVTRRDRDGDGVRNRHDRYPNDPRYR
jgi:hypothetical protein